MTGSTLSRTSATMDHMDCNVKTLLLSADEWRVKGDDATARGDFEKAIDCYSEAIGLVPTSHVYFICRSAAYIKCGDATKALVDAEKCIDLNPSWMPGYGHKGHALYNLGDFDSSIKAYKQGLDLEPNSAQLKKALAAVESSAQKYSSPSPASMVDAARAGDLPGINALLRMGCGVNESVKKSDEDGEDTPLGVAMVSKKEKAVRLLLAAGADVNIDINKGRQAVGRVSPIFLEVSKGRAEVVELLIKAGASVHEHVNEDQCTLLHVAVAYQGHVEVARVLLAAGARVDARTKSRRVRPITIAVRRGQADMVELLIKAGASVQEQDDEDGMTLLHDAAGKGHVEVARVLLAAGARIDATAMDDRRLPITCAVLSGHAGVVGLLLEAGSSVHEQDADGFSLLHVASVHGHVEVARVLLAAGARVEGRNRDGCAALLIASCECREGVVGLLVEAGADVNATESTESPTPLMGCLSDGKCVSRPVAARKTVQLLIKAGADVNAAGASGFPCAMQLAAMTCCPGIVQDLLDAGAKIIPRDNLGPLPLSSWVGTVLPRVAAEHGEVVNSAEWKQRKADTKAVLRGWKKKQQQATLVGRGGAGAGAGAGAAPGDCLIVRAKDGQCGKVQENGEKKKKKKKKKKAVGDENRVCDGPECNSVGVNRCKACKRPAYCGVECQRAHWNGGHKQECKMWRE